MLVGGIQVNPTIELTTITDPTQWYAYTLPNNTTHFIVNSGSTIQVSFDSAGATYATFRASEGGYNQKLKSRVSGLTLYLSSPSAGAVARIVSWQN